MIYQAASSSGQAEDSYVEISVNQYC